MIRGRKTGPGWGSEATARAAVDAIKSDRLARAQRLLDLYLRRNRKGADLYALAVAFAHIAAGAICRVRDVVAPDFPVLSVPEPGSAPEQVWASQFVNLRMHGDTDAMLEMFGYVVVPAMDGDETAIEALSNRIAALSAGASMMELYAERTEAQR